MKPFGDYLQVTTYLYEIMPNKEHPTDAGTCIWNVWNGKEWELKIKERWKPAYHPLTAETKAWLKWR